MFYMGALAFQQVAADCVQSDDEAVVNENVHRLNNEIAVFQAEMAGLMTMGKGEPS
jgi:hypothetical protein